MSLSNKLSYQWKMKEQYNFFFAEQSTSFYNRIMFLVPRLCILNEFKIVFDWQNKNLLIRCLDMQRKTGVSPIRTATNIFEENFSKKNVLKNLVGTSSKICMLKGNGRRIWDVLNFKNILELSRYFLLQIKFLWLNQFRTFLGRYVIRARIVYFIQTIKK